ncbi:hypothetical protein TNCV_3134241 [Trichonephila clavipes]|nr:hypothetical protein TNCV_3134241 [Trichonephila clavipes]
MGYCAEVADYFLTFQFGGVAAVAEWYSKFRFGDLSLQESDRSGRPSNIDNDVLRSILETNPYLTSQEIAEEFDIHHVTVGDHIKSLDLC